MTKTDDSNKKTGKPKPTIPINWVYKFISPIYNKLKFGDKIMNDKLGSDSNEVVLKIDFKKIRGFFKDDKVFDGIRKEFRDDAENTDFDIKEQIVSIYNSHLNQDDKKYELLIRDLHVIYENIEDFLFLEGVNDFRKDLSRYIGTFVYIEGYFAEFMLQKEMYYEKIVYECLLCGNRQSINQDIFGPRRSPDHCVKGYCKNNSKKLYKIVQKDSEVRESRVFELEGPNQDIFIRCMILSGCEYFDNKDIRLRNLLKVTGVLWLYEVDKDTQIYLIEVNNIENVSESYKPDKKIIKQIREKQKKDFSYCEKIIDSIFPLTQKIYSFFITKLIIILSIITSDSWDEKDNIRNSLNSIIGSVGGTFKSATFRRIRTILGSNNFGLIYGKSTTEKGLIPTAQRNNKEKNLVKRYGAFSYYNQKPLVIDEAHHLNEEAVETFKCFEDGRISRALDGTEINAEVKGSLIISLNFKTENEEYDCTKSLCENIGFPEKEKSILERFDLFYPIVFPNTLINKIIFKRTNFNTYQQISGEIIYNYILEVKRLYSEGISFTKDLENLFMNLYEDLLKIDLKQRFGLRHLNIIKKTLKGIAAINLKKQADSSDLRFLKKYLINTIIPLRDLPFIDNLRTIDISEIFRRTFILLSEIYDQFEISMHIEEIRNFLRDHYFPQKTDLNIDKQFMDISKIKMKTPEIDEYMTSDTGLTDNWRYRELIQDKEIRDFIEKNGYSMEIFKKRTFFIRNELKMKITSRIIKIIKENKGNPINLEDLLEVLSLDFEKDLIQKIIENSIQDQVLEKNSKNEILIKK